MTKPPCEWKYEKWTKDQHAFSFKELVAIPAGIGSQPPCQRATGLYGINDTIDSYSIRNEDCRRLGGLSNHNTFSTSAAIRAMGEHGCDRKLRYRLI